MDFDDELEPPPQNFLRRYRVAIIVTGVLLVCVIVVAKLASSGGGSSRRDPITMVSLPPPPPPPQQMTPPPPPPQDEQKMEQPMIKEEQPKEAPPKDEPPLGTGIKGDGPDSFGLSDKAGNGRIGPGGNGSKWGWYASQVQTKIEEALRRNRKTRSASLSVNVRVWPDATGRINRAQIAGSTGDPALDSALRDEVLTGLQLQEPPPAGMPAPITLRVTARRPH
jgi:TonB family protein